MTETHSVHSWPAFLRLAYPSVSLQRDIPLVDNNVDRRDRTQSLRTKNAVSIDGSVGCETDLIVHGRRGKNLDLIVDSFNPFELLHRVSASDFRVGRTTWPKGETVPPEETQ